MLHQRINIFCNGVARGQLTLNIEAMLIFFSFEPFPDDRPPVVPAQSDWPLTILQRLSVCAGYDGVPVAVQSVKFGCVARKKALPGLVKLDSKIVKADRFAF